METGIISARVQDMVRRVDTQSIPVFWGFLRPEEAAEVKAILGTTAARFYGGYDGAERTYVCFYPYWADEESLNFPITAVTFRYRECDKLSHKDFLGSLMALGIKRETVGDILIGTGRAVVFLSHDIAPYVLTQISTVGRIGVTLTEGYEGTLPGISAKTEQTYTVASLRLDCVVAALAGVSRSRAEEIIGDNRVIINSITAVKPTKAVAAGDVISIRLIGKFDIISADTKTKKGRTVLITKKYN